MVHYWWLVKADVREPVVYAAILALLLALRLPPVVPFLRSLPARLRRGSRAETAR